MDCEAFLRMMSFDQLPARVSTALKNWILSSTKYKASPRDKERRPCLQSSPWSYCSQEILHQYACCTMKINSGVKVDYIWCVILHLHLPLLDLILWKREEADFPPSFTSQAVFTLQTYLSDRVKVDLKIIWTIREI